MVEKLEAENVSDDEMKESSEFVEEHIFGENFNAAKFDKQAKNAYLISGNNVIAFDVRTGVREEIYPHNDLVIGLALFDGINKPNFQMITYTETPKIQFWRFPCEKLSTMNLKLPNGNRPLWFYEANNKHYILTVDNAENSTLFQILYDEINFANLSSLNNRQIKTKMVKKIGEKPLAEKHIAIGDGFIARIDGKRIKLIRFEMNDSSESDDTDEEEQMQNNTMITRFVLDGKFEVADQKLVEFDGVHIVGDTLFASVNIGRIYSWFNFRQNGISPKNVAQITLTGHRSLICSSEQGTLFVATGKGVLYKYNLAGTSGVGRWHMLQYMQLDAPPRSLAISADSTTLAVILTDNTVMIINAVGMELIAKAEAMNTPQTMANLPDYRFQLMNDPLNSGMAIMNARIGYIQWFDPFKWKTIQLSDIAEENVPHEDTFNRPNLLWLNTYLIAVSVSRIVTCECRRDNPNKTYLKFWRRDPAAPHQLALENCFVLTERISFIRSTLDYFDESESEQATNSLAENQEFLLVNSSGKMDVYYRDLERRGLWRRDLSRHEPNWQQSTVKSCSKINENKFATVNTFQHSTNVLIWDLCKMRITHILNTLKDANQVELYPHSTILIISTSSALVSFDFESNSFVWAILQPGYTIFTNNNLTFVYNQFEVYFINPENGEILRDPMKFSRPQKCIIPLETGEKISLCGINDQGKLSLLRPADMSIRQKENGIDAKIGMGKKQTPFSQVAKAAGNKRRDVQQSNEDIMEEKQQPLLNYVSLRKLVDGPAHTLPPITQLAERFVRACLTQKQRID